MRVAQKRMLNVWQLDLLWGEIRILIVTKALRVSVDLHQWPLGVIYFPLEAALFDVIRLFSEAFLSEWGLREFDWMVA